MRPPPRRPALGAAALLAALLAAPAPSEAQTLAALCRDGKIRLFHGRGGNVLATELAGPAPHAMLPAAEGLRVFVAQAPTEDEPFPALRGFSILTGRLEALVPLLECRGASGPSMDAERRIALACEHSEYFLEMTAGDFPVYKRHRAGRGLVAAVAHPATGSFVLLRRRPSELLVYDAESGEIDARLPAGMDPAALELGFGETLLAVLDRAGAAVRLFEPEAAQLSAPIAVGTDPRQMRFVGESPALLVTTAETEGLALVDLEAGSVQRRLHAGTEPGGLAVDPAGERAWIASEKDGTVTVVNLAAWSVEETFSIPGGPFQLVLVQP
jgi:hypothetical protein